MYRVLLYICLLLAISSVSLAEPIKPAHAAEISVEELLESVESLDTNELDDAPLWNSLTPIKQATGLLSPNLHLPSSPVSAHSHAIRAPPSRR